MLLTHKNKTAVERTGGKIQERMSKNIFKTLSDKDDFRTVTNNVLH